MVAPFSSREFFDIGQAGVVVQDAVQVAAAENVGLRCFGLITAAAMELPATNVEDDVKLLDVDVH